MRRRFLSNDFLLGTAASPASAGDLLGELVQTASGPDAIRSATRTFMVCKRPHLVLCSPQPTPLRRRFHCTQRIANATIPHYEPQQYHSFESQCIVLRPSTRTKDRPPIFAVSLVTHLLLHQKPFFHFV